MDKSRPLNGPFLCMVIALLLSTQVYAFGPSEIFGSFGSPRGVMDWSFNTSWTYIIKDNNKFRPELMLDQSYSIAKPDAIGGYYHLYTASAYLLERFDWQLSQRFQVSINAGPGAHILSSYATPGSPANGISNNSITVKGHLFAGMRYYLSSETFIGLSARSSFPGDYIIDNGYITLGRKLDSFKKSQTLNTSSQVSKNYLLFRSGVNLNRGNKSATCANITLSRKIANQFSLGLGVGRDCYKQPLIMPVFLDLRLHSTNSGNSIAVVMDVGASFGWIENGIDEKVGGPMAYIGLGYDIPISSSNSLNLEVGYKHQSAKEYKGKYISGYYASRLTATDFDTGVAQIGLNFRL
jgi:hypothetical protein